MTWLGLSVAVASLMSVASAAADTRADAVLRGLDPTTRLEQVCDLEIMKKIGETPNAFRPERAVIDALSGAKVSGDVIQGTGGAFRSKGKWYQFSFTCRTTPDRMRVLSLDVRVGTLIPEEKWDEYGLWR